MRFIPTSYYARKLFVLLAMLVLVKILDELFVIPIVKSGHIEYTLFYVVNLAQMVHLAWFVITLRCPSSDCRRPQIYRSASMSDLRLPGDNCYHCGEKLKQ